MTAMNAITFVADKQSGDHVKMVIGPTNRSEETRLGVIDYLIVGFFLLSIGGFIWLLSLS
jgi:hypothetical protein